MKRESGPIFDELLKALRDAAADRPEHRRLLEDLVSWQHGGGEGTGPLEEDYKTTWAVFIDLWADVQILFGEGQGKFSYPERRRKAASKAAKRARTMAGPSGTGLENLLRF